MIDFVIGGYGPGRAGEARGIGTAFISGDGALTFADTATEVASPSWLAFKNGIVYAALEESAEVAAYQLSDETLTALCRQNTAGDAPCHLAANDDAVIVASYRTGELGVHTIEPGGALAPLTQTILASGSGPLPAQKGPHAHTVMPMPDGRLLSLDLGTDELHIHRWIENRLERVSSFALPPGTAPRDLRSLADGSVAVLGEWSNELFLLTPLDETFRIAASIRLWDGKPGSQSAGLDVSADGQFLYSGLRGPDLISVVSREGDSLHNAGSVATGGRWPRHLVVANSSLYVANQHSNSIASFAIEANGGLTSLSDPTYAPSPTCLLPIPPSDMCIARPSASALTSAWAS